jgi:tetratricopeptide (TPR) repeat protein
MDARQSMQLTRLVAVCIVASVAGVPLLAQVPPPQEWKVLTERLERAALAGSGAELREVRTALVRGLSQSSGGRPQPITLYAIAYAGWRMATLPDVPRKEQDDLLGDAADRLKAMLKDNPKHAEAQALVGTIYGQQASRSTLRAIFLGPRSADALGRAGELEPANPRVLLLRGISALQTPSAHGGSPHMAEQFLRRSLDEFLRQPQMTSWPDWGRFDAHAWLGQALRRKGDLAGARAQYEKALAIAPDSRWLRTVLLPALERAGQK